MVVQVVDDSSGSNMKGEKDEVINYTGQINLRRIRVDCGRTNQDIK